MARPDAHTAAHLEWIGFVRPTGFVVSPTALVRAGVILDRRDADGQSRLREWVGEEGDRSQQAESSQVDIQSFATQVLGWSFSARGYAGTPDQLVPEELALATPDVGHQRPDYAVRMEPERRPRRHRRDLEVRDGGTDETETWQLLVCSLTAGEGFDTISTRQVAAGSH